MHLERHDRGVHALQPGAGAAGVTDVRFRCAPRPATRRDLGAYHQKTVKISGQVGMLDEVCGQARD
jgi:hypothetical protein